ncbi:MAG: hypothetical protein GF408_00310 [Candidatus Omnitrophica bacterium]|nr:hypothetical protein [Candidatus Omnitrophota bacterium]
MYKKTKEKNGLTTVVSPMKQMSSVSLGVWIGVGGRYESEHNSGISHVIEHMLFKGTRTRTAKDLKQAVEGVGGAFNGFTSDEVTCYMVKVPSKYMELGMDILADMILEPRFDKKDFLREKSVICEEIKMYRDHPGDRVMELLEAIMWPGSPLGRPLTGNISTVRNFRMADVLDFKEAHYHPGNIAVVASGKVSPERIFSYAGEKFSGLKRKRKGRFSSPAVTSRGPRTRFSSADTNQTHIALGFYAFDRNIKERFAYKLMNVILGGNMSSRLFEELREKYGLCYDISSMYKRHSDVGEVIIHSGVDNRNAVKSLVAILDELRNMKDIGITEDELVRAKEYTKGQFMLAMEGTSSRMLWLGDRFMVHREIPDVPYVLKKLDELTLEDVNRACSRVFNARAASLAMISNITSSQKIKVRKELEKL